MFCFMTVIYIQMIVWLYAHLRIVTFETFSYSNWLGMLPKLVIDVITYYTTKCNNGSMVLSFQLTYQSCTDQLLRNKHHRYEIWLDFVYITKIAVIYPFYPLTNPCWKLTIGWLQPWVKMTIFTKCFCTHFQM